MKGYRQPLADLVCDFCERSTEGTASSGDGCRDDGDGDDSDVIWRIFGDEMVLRTVEGLDEGGDNSTTKRTMVAMLSQSPPQIHTLRHHNRPPCQPRHKNPSLPRVVGAASALVAIFSQLVFTPFILEEPNLNLAARVYNILVNLLGEPRSAKAGLAVLQFLMRSRADHDHRLYFVYSAYRTRMPQERDGQRTSRGTGGGPSNSALSRSRSTPHLRVGISPHDPDADIDYDDDYEETHAHLSGHHEKPH